MNTQTASLHAGESRLSAALSSPGAASINQDTGICLATLNRAQSGQSKAAIMLFGTNLDYQCSAERYGDECLGIPLPAALRAAALGAAGAGRGDGCKKDPPGERTGTSRGAGRRGEGAVFGERLRPPSWEVDGEGTQPPPGQLRLLERVFTVAKLLNTPPVKSITLLPCSPDRDTLHGEANPLGH